MPSLADVLTFLFQLASRVDAVASLIQNVQALLGSPAQEPTLTNLAGLEAATYSLVQSQGSQIDSLISLVAMDHAQLVAILGDPQQSHVPVTLPKVPPPGYGGASSSDIASAVWNYVVPGDTFSTGGRLFLAGSFANNVGEFWRLPCPNNRYIDLVYDLANGAEPLPSLTTPDFDLSALLPADTVGSWLNRIDTQGNVWVLGPRGFWQSGNLIVGYGYWVCNISSADLVELKQLLGLSGGLNLAPVWPGLAKVTLGAAQALADGITIPGPLHGVVIHIASVPVPISYYPFGALKSYVHVGGIAFVDDNLQAETVQPIGLAENVVTPRSMVRADHALLRLQSGVVGTITPWAIV